MDKPSLHLLCKNKEGDLWDDIGGDQPVMFLKVAYCFDHWTCLLNAVLLNNISNYMVTYFLKYTQHALPILLMRKLRQTELSNSLTFAW